MTGDEIAEPGPPSWGQTIVRAVMATVPYVGGALEVVYSDIRQRRAAKAAELVEEITRIAGEQEFLARLSSDMRLERIFVEAVEAAIRTSIESKRHVLAQAVAAASADPGNIDSSELVIDALKSLEVQHVRALARLADEWDETRAAHDGSVGWGASEVWASLPSPIKATLVSTGTARPSPAAYVATAEPRRSEGVTDFGLAVVSLLRDEGWNYADGEPA